MSTDIKIGLIVRCDSSGLGYQTKALHALLKPYRTLVIDSTPFNGRQQHFEWYPDGIVNEGFIDDGVLRDFLDGIDVLVSCEVFYNFNTPKIAREKGVKTVLQPNAELNDYFRTRTLVKPDAFFLPSLWLERETRRLRVPTYYCPPPIDIDSKSQPRHKPKGELRVLHMQGRPAAGDRNGTQLVQRLPDIPGVHLDIHNQVLNDVEDQATLYHGYDVVLIPRRYGGLCLPMLEALSLHMPVFMPNIEPNNRILPKHWLLPAMPGSIVRTKLRVMAYNTRIDGMKIKLEQFRDMDMSDFALEQKRADDIYQKHVNNLNLWITYLGEVCKN